jgi:MFS superfamily sulfate permease-like transporter
VDEYRLKPLLREVGGIQLGWPEFLFDRWLGYSMEFNKANIESASGRNGSRLSLLQGIRPLSRAGAIRDALAGFELATVNIPQALGYTKIAGTPIVTGFYTLLLPLIAFALFGSSRYLVVAADSATAAILAGVSRTKETLHRGFSGIAWNTE